MLCTWIRSKEVGKILLKIVLGFPASMPRSMLWRPSPWSDCSSSHAREEWICEAVHTYEDQVADEGEKLGEKEKNRRRAMCGIGWLI